MRSIYNQKPTQLLILPPVLSFNSRNLYQNRLPAAAGTDKSKLISAQIWVKDISQHFKPMNKVWCAWLDPKAKSARATVEANLALPSLLVEIQVTCAV